MPQSIALTGILSVLWGVFTLIRILSLYEVNEHIPKRQNNKQISKQTNHLPSALAYDLTTRMNKSSYSRHGEFALKSFNLRNMTWFIIAGIYALYNIQINSAHIHYIETINHICTFFIIGAAFWAGQTYAYNKQASRALLGIFMLLIGISTYINDIHHIQFSEAIIKNNILGLSQNLSIFILLFLAVYCVITSLYAGLSSFKKLPIALLCSSLIILMATLYISTPLPASIPLWLSFWGLFSVLWVRCFAQSKKHYVLYQCQ